MKDEILRRLRTKSFGKNVHFFQSIDSTNTFAKTLTDAPEGTIVLAERQTHGRGRQGREWHSTAGKNLTFSIILRPRLSPGFAGIISLYAALAVAAAVRKSTSFEPQCKWPNDVLVGGKKICGILSEAVFSQRVLSFVVVGIGLNVNETEFPSGVLRPATSLALLCGKEFDRIDVLCNLLQELEEMSELLDDSHCHRILERWSSESGMLGKEVEIDQDGERVRGIARGLAGDGRLILDTANGPVHIIAGDTTIV